mmetsp:Transcript_5829/g.17544  ORF Transcript_5829/g.17544 Transcript_5829/m.17544 type:complete len:261 (-) Transcript_5829:550-1332(-)
MLSVVDDHELFLGARDGRVQQLAHVHISMVTQEHEQHAGELAALRLVDGHRPCGLQVLQLGRLGLVLARPLATIRVDVHPLHLVAARVLKAHRHLLGAVVDVGHVPNVAVEHVALRVVAQLDDAVADAVRMLKAPVANTVAALVIELATQLVVQRHSARLANFHGREHHDVLRAEAQRLPQVKAHHLARRERRTPLVLGRGFHPQDVRTRSLRLLPQCACFDRVHAPLHQFKVARVDRARQRRDGRACRLPEVLREIAHR